MTPHSPSIHQLPLLLASQPRAEPQASLSHPGRNGVSPDPALWVCECRGHTVSRRQRFTAPPYPLVLTFFLSLLLPCSGSLEGEGADTDVPLRAESCVDVFTHSTVMYFLPADQL